MLLDEVRRRMIEWADWLHAESGRPGRYAQIREAQMIGRGGASTAHALSPDHPDAEEIERHMCRLRDLDYSLFYALLQHFYYREPDMAAAEHCHCSRATYQRRVEGGLLWLAGRLG